MVLSVVDAVIAEEDGWERLVWTSADAFTDNAGVDPAVAGLDVETAVADGAFVETVKIDRDGGDLINSGVFVVVKIIWII